MLLIKKFSGFKSLCKYLEFFSSFKPSKISWKIIKASYSGTLPLFVKNDLTSPPSANFKIIYYLDPVSKLSTKLTVFYPFISLIILSSFFNASYINGSFNSAFSIALMAKY